MPETTLLTGADGYLGGNLARALLAGTDHQLVLTIKGTAADGGFAGRAVASSTNSARLATGGSRSCPPTSGVPTHWRRSTRAR